MALAHPNERLIMLSCSGKADMKAMPATMMKPTDFLFLGSRGIHRFHAITAVKLFDISDAPSTFITTMPPVKRLQWPTQ